MPNRKQKKQKCTVYINMRVVPGSHMITFITLLFINDGLFLYENNLKELSCAYVIVIDKYFFILSFNAGKVILICNKVFTQSKVQSFIHCSTCLSKLPVNFNMYWIELMQ